jgi:hypothetical protein
VNVFGAKGRLLVFDPGSSFASVFRRDAENADLKKELTGVKQEVDRLHGERAMLISKIEEGDGVNTVLQQLKLQNVRTCCFLLSVCFKS